MSILIKGMEMPEVAGRMEAVITILKDGTAQIAISPADDEIGYWKEYPLVPVPPHGRLGDLDALVERIDSIWDCNDMVFRPNDKICKIPEDCKGCKWAQTKDCIQRMVENAPTIIPAEEVKES